MTLFRVGPAGGGGGIPSALKNAMNAVFNKKFETSSVDYPPEDWPDDVNLLGPLPEKSASGAIAHFDDGADDVPLKSWGVTLDASLDGYNSVMCVSEGANLAYISGTDTENGYVSGQWVNSDGTTSSNENWTISEYLPIPSNTEMIISGLESNFPSIAFYDASKTFISGIAYNIQTSQTFTTPSNAVYCRISFNSAMSSKLMLEKGSTASAYVAPTAPTVSTVSLGRTIYGGSVDVVNGTGTDENGNDFTFTPITPTPETKLGVNNLWTDNGSDNQVEYRADIGLALGYNKYRYLKWTIKATRTTSSYVQMSEISFTDANDNAFTFPTGTTVTATATATSGTSPAYIIDGNTNTKYCGNWSSSGVSLNIDLGFGNTIDVSKYTKFNWYTANDATDRDPYTWELYGIDNAGTEILLCSRTAYTPTSDRKALADTVSINQVS
ncbi:MAG: hypothetical protein IKY16_02500 [Bacteroidales bacterium]|nr:hypothetical protein [Bacteroidales bacterium]